VHYCRTIYLQRKLALMLNKKALLFSVFMAIALSGIICSFRPTAAESPTAPNRAETLLMPDTLKRIFQVSCVGCHGTGGNMQAMAKLNFSKWYTYKGKKREKKAAAICKSLRKGSMPPSYLRESAPALVPTPAQVNLICDWAAEISK
jgi:mono/diheme cytochrome c family protein